MMDGSSNNDNEDKQEKYQIVLIEESAIWHFFLNIYSALPIESTAAIYIRAVSLFAQ